MNEFTFSKFILIKKYPNIWNISNVKKNKKSIDPDSPKEYEQIIQHNCLHVVAHYQTWPRWLPTIAIYEIKFDGPRSAGCYWYIRSDVEFHGITAILSFSLSAPAPGSEMHELFVHLRTHSTTYKHAFPLLILDSNDTKNLRRLQLVVFINLKSPIISHYLSSSFLHSDCEHSILLSCSHCDYCLIIDL